MILFLDIVSPVPSFSLINNKKLIHSTPILNKKNDKISDCIIPSFVKIQKEYNLNNKLRKLVVCTGPGSYTALRVGIAFMYGFSITKQIPLIGINCLELLKFAITKDDFKNTTIFIISSNKQNFYCTFSHKEKNYLVEKIENNINFSKLNNKTINSLSNFTLPSIINSGYKFKNNRVFSFSEILINNLNKLDKFSSDKEIKPIYISNNKILN